MSAQRKRGRPRAAETGRPAREVLLDAAARVFAQRGYAAASVERIVAAAALSKGTFYWHFASKDELFLTLLEERIDAPARSAMEITRTAPADSPTAAAVSRRLAEVFSGQRELLILLQEYWAAAVRSGTVRRRYRRRQRALVEALATALRARHAETGVALTLPAESLATALVALADGLAREALVDPDAVTPGLYGEILSLVYDGIASRQPG